ncbi:MULTISPECIES: nitrate/nitrite transporter [unclassified Sporosarcina]|uniref:MFS transporter n=1 Tax=unclassified Sporosarcina TaxID=2647733 RepID=UPI00203FE439|nr:MULTISPECIES: MFS transporter [unclassified Sporosarcina]GKV67358.1 MFS transporter [Sporosarcina sp. NCCP-2331]GLB57714.1 MFS transporter [Sporosarcina sp. NCCP-2378]
MQKATFLSYLNGILVMFMTFMYSLLLMAPAPVMLTIVETSNWNLGQVGMLISIIFLVVAVFALVGSVIINKIGAKWTAVISLALAAIGSMMAFFSGDSFALHLLGRVIVGVSWGIFVPLAPVVIAQWFPQRQHAAWMGARSALDYLGVAATFYITLPILSFVNNWQAVFGVYGIFMAVLCVIYILFARDPKRSGKDDAVEQAEGRSEKSNILRVIKNKTIILLTISVAGFAVGGNAFLEYEAAYLQIVHSYSEADAANVTGMMTIVAVISSIISGAIMIVLKRKKLLAISFIILMIVGALGVYCIDNSNAIIAFTIIFGIGFAGFNVYYAVKILDISNEPSFVGTAMALVFAAAWLLAFFIPIVLQGLLDLGMSMQIVMVIFLVPLIVSIIAIMLMDETGKKVTAEVKKTA